MPRLFVPYVRESYCALMLFKIPRQIERRKATPDMDLYDCVVGAYPDHIQVLKRAEASVESYTVNYADIEGFRLFRHFLLGVLTLYLKEGQVDITFNSVSVDIIFRFMEILRSRRPAGLPLPPFELSSPEPPADLDILFFNHMRDLGETFSYHGNQAALPLRLKSGSWTQKLEHSFRPRRLPATLHLRTGRELLIIQREPPEKENQESEYKYHYTYLPLADIHSICLEDEPQYQDLINCRISLAHHTFSLTFSRQNTGLCHFYQALAKQL